MANDARKKPRTYVPAQLDALVARKGESFSIPYAAVEQATISGMLGKNLRVKGARQRASISIPKSDLAAFSRIAAQLLRAQVQ